jgi:hypothetical protein
MLKNIKNFYGKNLSALDGDIGQARDFYFDDKTWAIRYLVPETGAWLAGRLVLLSPHAFGLFDPDGNSLPISLTRKQIEDSPLIRAHRPISRQFEEEYRRYYGWPAYWPAGAAGDGNLRSTRAIGGYRVQMTGYRIQTTDGLIGEASGFLLNDRSWVIRELVVETGPWHGGREILIPTDKIERISFEESKIYVNLTKAEIQGTAPAGADLPHAGVRHDLEVFRG